MLSVWSKFFNTASRVEPYNPLPHEVRLRRPRKASEAEQLEAERRRKNMRDAGIW